MGSKLGATLFALVFAVPFGAVGVLASWAIAHMVRESHRAGDWVIVQAKVDDAALKASRGSKGGTSYYADGAYRYTVGGKEFVSTKLGFDLAGGADNIGDWQPSMAAFLEEAKTTGKTIPVYVNPDNPAEAVVDRDVRWSMVLFMGVFAVLFGGVGVGALGAIVSVWFGKGKKKRAKARSVAEYAGQRNRKAVASAAVDATPAANPAVITSDGRATVTGVWIFTIIWNLISVPAGMMAWPEIVRGQWLVALVLLFPLIGALMLYSSIVQTFVLLRRGQATLALNVPEVRMGGRLGGVIRFERGRVGQEFDVRLVASRTQRNSDDGTVVPAWWRDQNARSAEDPRGGLRLPFLFELPARLNVEGVPPGEEAYKLRWQVGVKPRGSSLKTEDFDIRVEPSRERVEDLPLPEPTAEERRNAAAMEKLLGTEATAKLTDAQRASFAQLTPNAQATVAKIVNNADTIRKVAVGIAIAFFVLFVLAALT